MKESNLNVGQDKKKVRIFNPKEDYRIILAIIKIFIYQYLFATVDLFETYLNFFLLLKAILNNNYYYLSKRNNL